MAHRSAPTRNCCKFRTVQLGLCSRRRGDPMPSCYCSSCIGCQSSSGSHTSWQFGRTRLTAVNCGLPTLPNHGMCLQLNSMFICHLVAGPTIHQDRLFQTCYLVFSTVFLEIAATSNCLFVLKSKLKTSLFTFRLYWILIWPAVTASEITTVWCFRNLITITISLLAWQTNPDDAVDTIPVTFCTIENQKYGMSQQRYELCCVGITRRR